MSKRRDLAILHKPERAIADANNCSLDDVHDVLDAHPIEVDRDKYLRRALAMQLLMLDELECAFRERALNGDVASGTLLVKVAERRATLLGMNAPLGHSVRIVQHPPANRESSTDRIERVIMGLLAEQQAKTDPTSH